MRDAEPEPSARSGALAMIVHAGTYERVHYGLAVAAAAAAMDRCTSLLFAGHAMVALLANFGDLTPGWHALHHGPDGTPANQDRALCDRGIAGMEELLAAMPALGVRLLVCELAVRALDLPHPVSWRTDVAFRPGGLAAFLSSVDRNTATLFI